MAPVILELQRRAGFAHSLIATGQQDTLFDDAIAAFTVSVDVHLGQHPGGTMHSQMAYMQDAIESSLLDEHPDLVLVQGDTNSALAAARAAKMCGIAIGHVEAGLRSHNLDRPFPEECNRIDIATLATLHFAPSAIAAKNLANEGIVAGITVTGNPGIDAMIRLFTEPHAPRAGILATCHRRENFGEPLLAICAALREIANTSGETITLPVHPNPNVSGPIRAELGNHPNIILVEPMTYPDMLTAMAQSRFVITDSGGLQEECAALGVPLILLREETERPEVVTNGNAIIVGSDTNRIVAEAHRLSTDPAHYAAMSRPAFPYGKGNAATKIVDAIGQHFAVSG
jgi:UDP-N-acetylglucosamine 2-epimerase (non-hydrolysing)